MSCKLLLWTLHVTVLWLWNSAHAGLLSANVTEPISVSVIEGDLAILPCQVRDASNYRVIWMNPHDYAVTINSMRVTSDKRFSIEGTNRGTWDLLIQKVRKVDEGIWKCSVKSDPAVVRKVVLNVQGIPADPTFHNQASLTMTVQAGEDAILPCAVSDIGNYKVQWIFNDTELVMDDNFKFDNARLSMNTPYNLRISDVGHLDTGMYKCQIITSPIKEKNIVLNVRGQAKDHAAPQTSSVEESEQHEPKGAKNPAKDRQDPDSNLRNNPTRDIQWKTAKLQRRLVQEQIDFYRLMNYILKQSRQGVIKFFEKEL